MYKAVMFSGFLVTAVIYTLKSFDAIDSINYSYKWHWPVNEGYLNDESLLGLLSYNQSACRLYFQFGGFQDSWNGTGNFCETVDGQKAVCLDANLAPPSGVCVIYSFGPSASLSFERAMTSYGCDVYVFDRAARQIKKPSGYHHLHLLSMESHAVHKIQFKGKSVSTLASIRRYLKHTHRVIDFVAFNLEQIDDGILGSIDYDKGRSFKSVRQIGIRLNASSASHLTKHYTYLLSQLEGIGFVRIFARGSCMDRNLVELSLVNLNFSINV